MPPDQPRLLISGWARLDLGDGSSGDDAAVAQGTCGGPSGFGEIPRPFCVVGVESSACAWAAKTAAHFGHLTFFPLASSRTCKTCWQFGQEIFTASLLNLRVRQARR